MPRRAVRCLVDLNLSAVSAPGCWLPSKEECYLSVSLFSQFKNTQLLGSTFPILVNESFKFEKTYFTSLEVEDVSDLLQDELVVIELLQLSEYSDGAVHLATYTNNVREFLYPYETNKTTFVSRDRDIFLERTVAFPGISPKLEFSSRVTLKESYSEELDALEDAIDYHKSTIKDIRRTKRRPRSLSPKRRNRNSNKITTRTVTWKTRRRKDRGQAPEGLPERRIIDDFEVDYENYPSYTPRSRNEGRSFDDYKKFTRERDRTRTLQGEGTGDIDYSNYETFTERRREGMRAYPMDDMDIDVYRKRPIRRNVRPSGGEYPVDDMDLESYRRTPRDRASFGDYPISDRNGYPYTRRPIDEYYPNRDYANEGQGRGDPGRPYPSDDMQRYSPSSRNERGRTPYSTEDYQSDPFDSGNFSFGRRGASDDDDYPYEGRRYPLDDMDLDLRRKPRFDLYGPTDNRDNRFGPSADDLDSHLRRRPELAGRKVYPADDMDIYLGRLRPDFDDDDDESLRGYTGPFETESDSGLRPKMKKRGKKKLGPKSKTNSHTPTIRRKSASPRRTASPRRAPSPQLKRSNEPLSSGRRARPPSAPISQNTPRRVMRKPVQRSGDYPKRTLIQRPVSPRSTPRHQRPSSPGTVPLYQRPPSPGTPRRQRPSSSGTPRRHPVSPGRGPLYQRPASPSGYPRLQRPASQGQEPLYQRAASPRGTPRRQRPTSPERAPMYQRPTSPGRGPMYQRPTSPGRGPMYQRPITPDRDPRRPLFPRPGPSDQPPLFPRSTSPNRSALLQRPSSPGRTLRQRPPSPRGGYLSRPPSPRRTIHRPGSPIRSMPTQRPISPPRMTPREGYPTMPRQSYTRPIGSGIHHPSSAPPPYPSNFPTPSSSPLRMNPRNNMKDVIQPEDFTSRPPRPQVVNHKLPGDKFSSGYGKPDDLNYYNYRSTSPTLSQRIEDIDLYAYADNRPPFVVRKLDTDLIGRKPGGLLAANARSKSHRNKIPTVSFDGYNDLNAYTNIKRNYAKPKFSSTITSPVPRYSRRYLDSDDSDLDDDSEVAGYTSRGRPLRARSVSPGLRRPRSVSPRSRLRPSPGLSSVPLGDRSSRRDYSSPSLRARSPFRSGLDDPPLSYYGRDVSPKPNRDDVSNLKKLRPKKGVRKIPKKRVDPRMDKENINGSNRPKSLLNPKYDPLLDLDEPVRDFPDDLSSARTDDSDRNQGLGNGDPYGQCARRGRDKVGPLGYPQDFQDPNTKRDRLGRSPRRRQDPLEGRRPHKDDLSRDPLGRDPYAAAPRYKHLVIARDPYSRDGAGSIGARDEPFLGVDPSAAVPGDPYAAAPINPYLVNGRDPYSRGGAGPNGARDEPFSDPSAAGRRDPYYRDVADPYAKDGVDPRGELVDPYGIGPSRDGQDPYSRNRTDSGLGQSPYADLEQSPYSRDPQNPYDAERPGPTNGGLNPYPYGPYSRDADPNVGGPDRSRAGPIGFEADPYTRLGADPYKGGLGPVGGKSDPYARDQGYPFTSYPTDPYSGVDPTARDPLSEVNPNVRGQVDPYSRGNPELSDPIRRYQPNNFTPYGLGDTLEDSFDPNKARKFDKPLYEGDGYIPMSTGLDPYPVQDVGLSGRYPVPGRRFDPMRNGSDPYSGQDLGLTGQSLGAGGREGDPGVRFDRNRSTSPSDLTYSRPEVDSTPGQIFINDSARSGILTRSTTRKVASSKSRKVTSIPLSSESGRSGSPTRSSSKSKGRKSPLAGTKETGHSGTMVAALGRPKFTDFRLYHEEETEPVRDVQSDNREAGVGRVSRRDQFEQDRLRSGQDGEFEKEERNVHFERSGSGSGLGDAPRVAGPIGDQLDSSHVSQSTNHYAQSGYPVDDDDASDIAHDGFSKEKSVYSYSKNTKRETTYPSTQDATTLGEGPEWSKRRSDYFDPRTSRADAYYDQVLLDGTGNAPLPSRPVSPVLNKARFRDRFSEAPFFSTSSKKTERAVERSHRYRYPTHDTLNDLARDTSLAKYRSQVHIDNGHYWTERAARLSGKSHRLLFNDNISKIYNKLYKHSSNLSR